MLASTLFPENGESIEPRRVLEEKVIFTKERLKLIATRSVHSHVVDIPPADTTDGTDIEKKVEKRNMQATKSSAKMPRPTQRPSPSSLNSMPYSSTSSLSGATTPPRKLAPFRIGRVFLGCSISSRVGRRRLRLISSWGCGASPHF